MVDAYSYIRFSTAKQERGDSLKRQTKLAVDYAEKHGLNLHTRSYEDLGVSAFRGSNAADGKLRMFLDAVHKGVILKGSFLLVESLDRISRDKARKAVRILEEIVDSGVNVVTLTDGKVYTAKSLSDDPMAFMWAFLVAMRAHEESEMKSSRSLNAWKNKRAAGKIMTSIGPAWLRLADDRLSWIVLADRAATVRTIFDLATQGIGTPTIARRLNATGSGTLREGKPWSVKTVYKLLTDRAVIGEFYPKHGQADAPIETYYPAVITTTSFLKVQEGLKKRRYIGGPASENQTNVLAGILFCKVCGRRMRILGAKGKYRYIQCQNAYSGGECTQRRMAYRPIEMSVLALIGNSVQTLVAEDGSPVEDPRVLLEEESRELGRKIGNLLDSLSDVKSPLIADKINALQAQLDEVNQKIDSAVPQSLTRELRAEAAALIAKVSEGDVETMDRDERLRVRAALKQLIKRVECATDGDEKTLDIKLIGPTRPNVNKPIVDKILKII